jgi:predicted HTH domain antitoxin
MYRLNLEVSAALAAQLEGYDASELLQLGLREALMRAQLRRLEAGQISIWRAAEEAAVGLRQMIEYAAAHGIAPHYDAADTAEELAAW